MVCYEKRYKHSEHYNDKMVKVYHFKVNMKWHFTSLNFIAFKGLGQQFFDTFIQ